jgi:hypothetical protein
VLDCFPDRQEALLQQLGAQPEQQFAYLKCLVAMHQRQAGQEEAAPAAAAAAAAPLRAGARSPGLSALLGDSGVANLYLRLLCQYEPHSGGCLLECVWHHRLGLAAGWEGMTLATMTWQASRARRAHGCLPPRHA